MARVEGPLRRRLSAQLSRGDGELSRFVSADHRDDVGRGNLFEVRGHAQVGCVGGTVISLKCVAMIKSVVSDV